MNLNSTTQRIGMVCAGATLLLVAVWYFAFWSPQGHRLTQAHAAQTAAEAKVTQLKSQVAQFEALERNIPADKLKLAKYTAAIPSDPQLSAALNQIQAAATATNVSLTSISPSGAPSATAKAQSASGVPDIGISMSVTGTYAQDMSFITSLGSMPRTLVITNLALSGGSGSAISTSISAEIFYSGQSAP